MKIFVVCEGVYLAILFCRLYRGSDKAYSEVVENETNNVRIVN